MAPDASSYSFEELRTAAANFAKETNLKSDQKPASSGSVVLPAIPRSSSGAGPSNPLSPASPVKPKGGVSIQPPISPKPKAAGGSPVPAGGLAARRGFKDQQKGGLSIVTKKSGSTVGQERKSIQWVDSFNALYSMGSSVMPSSHSGMQILFATHKETGDEVVIKVRQKSNSFCDKTEEKEWRESTEFMLNFPQNPGIAKIYDVFEDRVGYYVVMEKVPGQDLFETMTGKGLLPIAEVKEVLRQLLQALKELHGRNCIHKDLKLENVMFDRTPPPKAGGAWGGDQPASPITVKLIDFDTVETFVPQTPKRTKDVLGTDQYIAQEAYDGNYSPASDIFAVGVIGYRLLTSRFPFKSDIFNDEAGENWVGSPKMREIRQKLCNYKIDWSHRVFTLEPQARELLRGMLAVNEQARPSAQDALDHPWLAGQPRRRSLPNLADGPQSPTAVPGQVHQTLDDPTKKQ